MSVTTTEHDIRRKYEALSPLMDERMRRCWAGVEADVIGEGGIAIVERATGMSRTTIRAGRDELRGGVADVEASSRQVGGQKLPHAGIVGNNQDTHPFMRDHHTPARNQEK